jgi:GNAT superfamily N-acetyltransferase
MHIREAVPGDAAAIARVQVDTWRDAYAGIVPTEYLAGLRYQTRELRAREHLADLDTFAYVSADDAGEVFGFAFGGPNREGDAEYEGELRAIYVRPGSQRSGAGRALVQAVAERLREQGMCSMIVWTFRENAARGFYERLGGVYVREKPYPVGGADLVAVAYGWSDTRVLGVGC